MGQNRSATDRRKTKRPGSLDRRGSQRIRSPRNKDAVLHTRKARALWKKNRRKA